MAEKIVVEIDLETGESTLKEFKDVERQARDHGKRAGDKFEEGFKERTQGVLKLAGQLAAVAATIASALTLKESIEAAINQEEAVQNLNTSLALAGTFSEEASKRFQDLASNLQQTTTVGDETTLALASLARNFTRTNEEAEKLTRASIELSAATGLSLESSVKNLGKTFGGLTGELGESLPIIKNLTTEQLKAGAALDLVLDRFSGAAASKVNTFAGAIKQLSNAFSDSLEQQGFLITKSPVVISLIQALTKRFINSTNAIKKFRDDTGDIFKPIVTGLITVGSFVNKNLIQPLELAFSIGKRVFEGLFGTISGAFGTVTGTFTRIRDGIFELFNRLTPFLQRWFDIAFDFISAKAVEFSQSFIESLKTAIEFVRPFAEAVIRFLGGFLEKTTGGFDSVIENVINKIVALAETIRPVLTALGVNVDTLGSDIREKIENIVPEGDTFEEKMQSITDNFSRFRDMAGDKFVELKGIIQNALTEGIGTPLSDELENRLVELQNFVDSAKVSTDNFKNNAKGIATATQELSRTAIIANQAYTKAISGGIQNIIASMAKGEDAFKNFGNFILNTFGDLAIQLGTFYIAQGIANLALRSLDPTGTIAAGAGLVALGAIMKSFFAGGSSSQPQTANTGAAAPGFAQQQENQVLADPTTIAQAEERVNLQLNIEGSLIREKEAEGFVARLLERGSRSGSTVIPSLRTA